MLPDIVGTSLNTELSRITIEGSRSIVIPCCRDSMDFRHMLRSVMLPDNVGTSLKTELFSILNSFCRYSMDLRDVLRSVRVRSTCVCVCVCVCVCARARAYGMTGALRCTANTICMHTYMYACTHVCMHAYIHIRMHARMRAYMHTQRECVCVCERVSERE